MVWFQCEDCGDNLKKPKLPGHFRVCSAFKLSCIDCGEVFSQQTVESHTQCISEAEKYGPKGQGKTPNGKNAKPNNETKQKPDVDINVGLSDRPPWFCSLCNTKATSKQTLLLHADGKKHRAKARAFQAANQQPGKNEATNPDATHSTDNNPKEDAPEAKANEEPKELNPSEAENEKLQSNKKRKVEVSDNGAVEQRVGGETSVDLGNGEVIQVVRENHVKRAKTIPGEEDIASGKKIKWKKLITSALKSNPDGTLKFKKLEKAVLKSLRESGFTDDESQVKEVLEKKINKSSRFAVEGKRIRLVAKS
ncbi:UBP1-associated proteins 1C [Ipomoea triloba]|uniref:UBP1-associated proteins 1C n=1 Tax=Ipomoea triloba TaxID=35885 RepID=UPI00125CECB2|nr:UBP1-associated proteins 1C [Ipomoea triloba]